MYWKLPNDKQRRIIMDILTALADGDKVSVKTDEPEKMETIANPFKPHYV